MTHRLVAALVLTLGCVASIAQAQDPGPERIRIEGSHRLGQALVPAIVDQWLSDIGYEGRRQVRRGGSTLEIHASRDGEPLVVEIRSGGTAVGMAAIINGDADLSMSTREPTDLELDAAWQLGNLRSPTQEWVLGLDGVVALVPKGNPVSALRVDQLRDLVAGKLRDWRAVGGPATPITLHTLGPASGTLELASGLLIDGARLSVRQVPHTDHASLLAAVAADPGAVALVSLKAPRGGLKALALRGPSGDVSPDPSRVVTEDYPLQRRVYLHSGTLIPALARSLAQYAVSPAGQAVVERSAFASVGLRLLQAPPRDRMPPEYVSLLGKAERLPVTLRFSNGLDLFDSRSRQDIDRLITFLGAPGNARRGVVLMSFANPRASSPYQTLALSHERVDYVASELRALGINVVMVRGFGGQMPVANPALASAHYRNNRVEVWLR